MKKKLLLMAVALMCAVGSWADDYVYLNTFDNETGVTKKGNVTIEASGEDAFGGVYKNPGSTSPRSNYLVIPSEVLHKSETTKQLTIGFWVKAVTENASNTYMWAPIFTAYESENKLEADNWTHLGIEYRGVMEYNLNGPGNSGENWCDFTNEQQTCHNGGNNILYHDTNDWLKDKQWHYMTIVFDASKTSHKATIYMDGQVGNEWTLDGSTAGQDLGKFFSNASKLDYVCFGGCQIRGYNDNDAPFWYDDLYITNKALNSWDIKKIMFDKDPAAYIANKKGDLTDIINGDFQTNADGWSGGGLVTVVRDRGWRGTDHSNDFYETNYTGNLTCTLKNMPAGAYKVVAAVRGWDGNIQAQIAGANGMEIECVGDAYIKDSPEINLNGVEMPSSDLGGFTTHANGHNWRWISASGTLATSGDLVLNFAVTSNNTDWRWFAMDDVHLYCTSFGGTSYTTTIGTITNNIEVTNTGNNSVVTCDIVMSNPNCMIYPTGGVIMTAAGQTMNNNMVYTNGAAFTVENMVLYDGHPFTIYNNKSYYFTSATLYRRIPADTWCSLVVPFWPTTNMTMKYPSEFIDGTLSFSDVERTTWANDKPMIIKSSTELTSITGKRAGANGGGNVVTNGDMISGSGVPMTGVYTSGNVPQSTESAYYYILGTDNKLHKVTGEGVTISPFRAYFSVSDPSLVKGNAISLNFDDSEDGITEVSGDKTSREQTNVIYNLAGQRLSKMQRGINIVNGKKFIVK